MTANTQQAERLIQLTSRSATQRVAHARLWLLLRNKKICPNRAQFPGAMPRGEPRETKRESRNPAAPVR